MCEPRRRASTLFVWRKLGTCSVPTGGSRNVKHGVSSPGNVPEQRKRGTHICRGQPCRVVVTMMSRKTEFQKERCAQNNAIVIKTKYKPHRARGLSIHLSFPPPFIPDGKEGRHRRPGAATPLGALGTGECRGQGRAQ